MSNTAIDVANRIGYLTRTEVNSLKLLAMSILEKDNDGDVVIVNVGAGAGTSGLAFMESRDDMFLYTIDIQEEGNPYGGLTNERNAFVNAEVERKRNHDRIHGDSREVAREWKTIVRKQHSEIDVLFIDDGHAEDEVTGDIDLWLPNVRSGGIVIFHDYGSLFWGDVKTVVDRKMSNFDTVLHLDTMKAFRV